MNFAKYKTIIASDVSGDRDGIGVEIYYEDNLIIEIFRDDTMRERTVTMFQKDIPLNILEECIVTFKKEIPLDFVDYKN